MNDEKGREYRSTYSDPLVAVLPEGLFEHPVTVLRGDRGRGERLKHGG